MPQYLDQYFLVANRDSEFVSAFLNRYLPDRKSSAEDYPVDSEAHTPIIFSETSALLRYLEAHPDKDYSIYWRSSNPVATIQHAMAFYTRDGQLILGISITGRHPEEPQSTALFKAIKTFLSAKVACITAEEPPPDNVPDFINFAAARFPHSGQL
ncbi:hypothetical protein [Taibaiella chishuiensis]|uniref:Uncharacterized protein n=1 Tax=Taibaiella chishuiensis TaxID=1434707 RepID=A0A2P8D7A8_9BACT|nr:hypothetical protein [Taibaiella chishuiensis]PSK93093.1 hypothetical protein B0I18_10262 [Taibaiella chishuiensis]